MGTIMATVSKPNNHRWPDRFKSCFRQPSTEHPDDNALPPCLQKSITSWPAEKPPHPTMPNKNKLRLV